MHQKVIVAVAVSLVLVAIAPQGQATTRLSGCEEETDHTGWGSTTATCDYACYSGEQLYVYVLNSDPHNNIPVDASTSCDSQSASCTGTQSCEDYSSGTTSGSDYGSCVGHADESWDSGTYAKCERISGGTITGSASMTFVNGVATGEICERSTSGLTCLTVTPVCNVDDGVTCWIGTGR